MDRAHDRRSWTRSPLIYTDSDTPSPSCLTRARVRTRPSRAAYLRHFRFLARNNQHPETFNPQLNPTLKHQRRAHASPQRPQTHFPLTATPVAKPSVSPPVARPVVNPTVSPTVSPVIWLTVKAMAGNGWPVANRDGDRSGSCKARSEMHGCVPPLWWYEDMDSH
jgi:hypothetical protein